MSREHAYAYESGYKSGYRDGSINYELEHCPACKNIADLQKALIENYRLRELVRYAYECAIHSDHATCDDCRRMNSSCILADRMRELTLAESEDA